MNQEISLRPEELFFLGDISKAVYIDYDYAAAMGDIQQRYAVIKRQVLDSLSSRGILSEDFGGNLTVNINTQSLLNPIFFAQTETSFEFITVGNEPQKKTFKFHNLNGQITQVIFGDDLKLSQTEPEQIKSLLKTCLPAMNDDAPDEALDKNRVTHVLSFKKGIVSIGAQTKIYLVQNGCLYTDDKNGNPHRVTADEFLTQASDLLGGM